VTEAARPLISWPDPVLQLAGFLAVFVTLGAIGLRYRVLPGLMRSALADERELAASSTTRAARLALAGAALTVIVFAIRLPQMSAQRHLSIAAMFARDPMLDLQAGLSALALAGFGFAAAGIAWGWLPAAVGVVVGLLRAALIGQWSRMLNPVHELAGGLWIGTLFIVLSAALPVAMRPSRTPERRAALAALLIREFSPLALTSAAVLGVFGVLTAWRHLKHWSALWTTPYGITLLIKLGLVAIVLALGAWNWRRMKPRLGEEAGARLLRRSALVEVSLAGAVLAVTAVLVSLPSP